MLAYQCDPDLNIKCPKTNCLYNKNALLRTCGLTTSMKYAVSPVTPINIGPKLFKEELLLSIDQIIQALEELKQDYIDDRHYYTALAIAVELIERYHNEQRIQDGNSPSTV